MDQITLDPADYWQLRARMQDVAAANAKAQQLVAEANAKHDAHAKALVEKYPGFALDNAAWRLDDATCSLVRQG